MFSGGIADKTGNRFEARWLTRELIGLIDGRALSITIETIGDDDEGFEFVVERETLSEWHQCKRQTSANTWTIAALGSAGVIGNFGTKLAHSPAQRCVFVSTDTVKQIKLLQEKRRATPILEEFEKALSKTEVPFWQDLQTQIAASGESAADWLDRCDFHAVSEDILEETVASELAYWFRGDPDLIVGAIRAWIEEDQVFNRPIDRAAFLSFAADKQFELKQYEADQTLPGRLVAATADYDATYVPVGGGLFNIPRPETEQLIEALIGDTHVKTVALVGAAGSGKSVVVRDAIARIAAQNFAQLAFRVDQVGEPLSLAQLGTAVIDVADSPAVILEKLSGNRPAILYIDQADAVSQMSGRSAQVRRQIVDLVNQAARYPNIRVVFSCRTFDINNDHLFADIAARDDSLRIDIPALNWDRDVVPLLQQFEISINPDNPRIKALLVQPIGLSIAVQLVKSGAKDLRNVDNLSELFTRLLVERDRAVRERFNPPWSIYAALEAISNAMSDRQELIAPVRVLDPFAGASDILQQEGLIVVNGPRVSLIHESLFDFLHARAFVGGSQSLLDFLTASEQTLFRRTQVRQILAAERDLDRKRYLADLDELLASDKVRTHVSDLVLRWLGTVSQPDVDEWDILARHAARKGDGEVPRSIGMTIFDQAGWFRLLAETGIVAGWLEGSLDGQEWALNFLRSISDAGPDLAVVLSHYLDTQPERAGLLLERMHWLSPRRPAPEIGGVLIRALGMVDKVEQLSQGEDLFELHASWITHAPADAARILAASLAAWYRLVPEGAPFKPTFENGTGAFSHLVELAKALPLATLEAILPSMHVAMMRLPGDAGPPYQDKLWYWRRCDSDDDASIEFIDVIRSALADVAVNAPGEVDRLLALLEPDAQITGLHLLLETVASNGEALAPLLTKHRSHPALFTSGWDGAPGHSAAKAIAATWDWLDDETRSLLEGRILGLWPEFDDVKWALSLRDPAKNWMERTPEQIREIACHCLADSGRRQWSVMKVIGPERLSAMARDRFRCLDRKAMRLELPDGMRVGTVRPPIAPDRAAHMTDEAWLIAIDKVRLNGRPEWDVTGFRGGANELAHVLQNRVKEEPDRFLALLQHIPKDAAVAFPNAIVMGISEAGATPERTERLFEILDTTVCARPEDRPLIWLLRATKGARGPRTLAFMLEAAASGDSESGVGEQTAGKPDKPEAVYKQALAAGVFLDSRATNSVRGAALMEIGSQAWKSAEQFATYRNLFDGLIGNEMPDYIHAAMGPMLIAALKHDPDLAAAWATRTAAACLSSFFTRSGRHILFWLDARRPDIGAPIIEALAGADDPLAQAIGCLIIAERSLDDPRWAKKIEELIEVGPTQRGAIAEVAATYLPGGAHIARTTQWLTRFFEDDDEGVRAAAIDCFRRINAAEMAKYVPLYTAYVNSRFFNAERTYFLHRLGNAPGAMDDVVLGLIEKSVYIVKSGAGGAAYGLYQIWDPLLRIYASCGTNEARLSKCLNVIDDLVLLDAVGSTKLNALT